MDGFQTTTAIKTALPEDKRPTIISVTASESAEESLKCLALGMGNKLDWISDNLLTFPQPSISPNP